MSKVVVLTDVEIDFARLVKPEAINGQGEPKYSCVVVWDKANGDNRTKLANAIQEAIAKGAEKGVAQGVYRHIAVRMGYAAYWAFYLYSAQPEREALGEGMHIVSVAYSYVFHCIVYFNVFR